MKHADQLHRIRDKLQRARDSGASCFGSASHRFELGPPLPTETIEAFESETGTRLPECYRSFLEHVGHNGPNRYGGAGPFYGLMRLQAWDEFATWVMDDVPSDFLARPCPLVPGPNEVPFADDIPDEDWDDAMRDSYCGIATIASQGCTYMAGLIVTGEARGRVVYLDAQQCSPPYVSREETFLDWYERWLDELLGGYRMFWYGYGPGGGESELLDIITSTDDEVLRGEAIANLGNLPARSDRCWDVLEPCLRDEAFEIRRVTVTTFRHAPQPRMKVVEPLLSDPDDRVKNAAVRTWNGDWNG